MELDMLQHAATQTGFCMACNETSAITRSASLATVPRCHSARARSLTALSGGTLAQLKGFDGADKP